MKKNVKNLFGGLIVTITFVMGITGCGNNKDENKQLSLVSLDINPSIELFVNNDGIIQNVNGINDEAKNILKDLDLSNDSLEEGISEIIEETIEKGYIKNIEENDILVSIDGTSVYQTLILREKTKSLKKKYITKSYTCNYICHTLISKFNIKIKKKNGYR